MQSDIGFLKIDGHLFPVHSMTLRCDEKGQGLQFIVHHHGVHTGCTGLIQLFTSDGHPVIGEGMDQTHNPVTVPAMGHHDHLTITYNLNFGHVPITSRTWTVKTTDEQGNVIPPMPKKRWGKHAKVGS